MTTQERNLWQAIQRKTGTRPDGIPGLATATAVADQLGIDLVAPKLADEAKEMWPRDTDAEMQAFYGDIGSGHTKLEPPYPLLYEGRPVKTITVHENIARSVTQALTQTLEYYGIDEIKRLKLNRFDG